MARVAEYQAVQFDGFPDGLNRHADSSRLKETELAIATNIRLGSRGEVKLRSGYLRQDANLTDQIDHLFPWRTDAGVDFIIGVTNGGIIVHDDELDGNWWNSGYSVGDQSTLINFGVGMDSAFGKIYVSAKQIGDVRAFNGVSWASVPAIPKGKHLVFRHGRMFSANTTANPARIFFSGFLTPESFATEDWVDVSPDDGYEINAAVRFGDDLIVMKDKSVHKLAGRSPESFALYEVDTHRGCVSPRSLAQIRGRLVFFDRDTGVWAFNGASFELVSEPINDYILDGQDYGLAYRASAYVGEDRYYLSVPWAGGGFKTFVYFADTEGWAEYDTGFEGATSYLGDRYLGFPGADGVWTSSPSSDLVPPSTTINAVFRTPWVRVAGAGAKARIRRVEMTVKGPDTTSFTVRMFRDFNPDTPYITRTFSAGKVPYGGSAALLSEERVIASDGWGNRVHAVQFEFDVTDSPFQLNDLSIFYTGGIDVRGER